MLVKAGGAAALLIGGLYAGGVLGGGYAREVGRPQGEVMRALEDLDITAQPGAPGTDPARSGGVKPLFRLERTADSMTWIVMSGNQVATRMIADFKAIDSTHTKVTAHVERGDAPDDFVSPAFRSKGVTLGLFSMALEGELNELTGPATDVAGCERLMEGLQDRMTDAAVARYEAGERQPASLSAAMGDTARTVMTLHAVEGERRRLGCKDADPNSFTAPTQLMRAADDAPAQTRDGVSFVPGKPMIDPSAPAAGW